MAEDQDNFDPTHADGSRSLDAYADGLLSDDARAAFELRLNDDASLRAEMERHRRVHAALRRTFVPPAASAETILANALARHEQQAGVEAGRVNGVPRAIVEREAKLEIASRAPGAAQSDAPRSSANWRRTLALAAMSAVIVGAAAVAWQLMGDSRRTPYRPPSVVVQVAEFTPLDVVYRAQVANDMRPGWLCKDNEEFGNYFQNRLGQKLFLYPTPTNAQLLGVSFTGGVSPQTMGVLAKVDGQPVVVFADRASAKPKEPLLRDASGLHVHTRQVGDITLYEVSPHAKPHLLDIFFQPKS